MLRVAAGAVITAAAVTVGSLDTSAMFFHFALTSTTDPNFICAEITFTGDLPDGNGHYPMSFDSTMSDAATDPCGTTQSGPYWCTVQIVAGPGITTPVTVGPMIQGPPGTTTTSPFAIIAVATDPGAYTLRIYCGDGFPGTPYGGDFPFTVDGPPATTTTTTTTVAPTTTTAPTATTTTAPPTTTAAVTTTMAAATTTSDPQPTTEAPATTVDPTGALLPATGTDTLTTWLALTSLLVGLGLLATARRRVT